MKRTFLTLLCAIGLMANAQTQADYRIIPLPDSIAPNPKGGAFTLTSGAVVSYPEGNDDLRRQAEMLCDGLSKATPLSLTTEAEGKKGAAISLNVGLNHVNPEAYTITVTSKGIVIRGASESGVFRATQTLRKAIGVTDSESVNMPCATISDSPRFPYRGAHLDCARHFFPVDFIKTYLDILALHGCNNFHWHLTDDQGWRFEVKSMPLLTEEGSIRKETEIGSYGGLINDEQEYGRGLYYTQEQCREIVAYAAERHINVIPEVEIPGHMVAALHIYPELGCTGGPYEVWTHWGVSPDILCAGNPETLVFLHKVLDELTDVFPSKLIHIGGDEAPRKRWRECPKCQAKMQELGLTNEAQLQTYINRDLEKFLATKGRTVIGWDEVLEGGLSDSVTVMNWHGPALGVEAARQGHDVILCPMEYCYLDYYQLRDRDDQPRSIGGYIPLSHVYSMEPVPAELTKEESRHIIGAQCNLWAEHIAFPQHMEYMILPRLSALSEVQWTNPRKKDYADFQERLPRLIRLYDKLGYKHCQGWE